MTPRRNRRTFHRAQPGRHPGVPLVRRSFCRPCWVLAAVIWWAGILPADAAPPSASWPVVWGDEFNGTSLDASKWKWGSLPWGGRHHTADYASYITPEDSYVQNGSLWLRCRQAAGGEFGGYPYSEGFVHSDGRKNYTYGHLEIRARFPSGKGVWPAFWTLPWGWPPEFDIAEYFGSDDRMHMGLAYDSSGNVTWSSSNFYAEGWSNWHTYALEWGPGYAIWYKDGGVKKSLYADYVPAQPMYVILNSGMRYDADATTPLPNYFEVDYCRLFSPPTVTINDNTTGTGLHQFNYVGAWSYGAQTGAFFTDNHWSSTTGACYQIDFNGARVDIYAAKAPGHGIAGVSIDGGPEQFVDFYAAARTDKTLVWSSPSLVPGPHTLKVRATGTKNAAGTGYVIPADRVDVWPTAGRLSGTVIGTAGSYNNSGNTREKAFDGDLTTFFDAPTANGAWTGLDLGMGAGAGTRITRVRYCPRNGYAARMVGGRIQAANQASFTDAVDLFTIAEAPPVETFCDQSITHPGAYRYVRYLSPPGGYGNIAELEFEGYCPPPAPANLTAEPAHSQVSLRWTASPAATHYNVKRAVVSGGPYTVLSSNAATSFTDSGLTTATRYYYVVSAVSDAGESLDSGEVSARSLGPHFDFDGDQDVDQTDLLRFLNCVTGEGMTIRPPACTELQFLGSDSDADSDVDQSDFGFFQRCLDANASTADAACR